MDDNQWGNMHRPKLEKVVFRPSVIGIVFPAVISIALWYVAYFLKVELRAPSVAWCFVGIMSVMWMLHALSLLTFSVSMCEQRVEIRWFRMKSIEWSSIREWSDYSTKSTLYFRTSDGSVHDLLGFCVFGRRKAVASELFYVHVGEPKVGSESVAPSWMKALEEMFGKQ
ncbi:hypothetical protein SH467x_001966 [Pirellulaceae bacterium SH467]